MTELAELIHAALGHDLDAQTFASLSAIQTRLRQRQAELLARFDDGEISDKQYLVQVHAALQEAMRANKALLGDERFRTIFGEAGDQPEELIDKDVFFENARRRPRGRR